MDKYAGLIGTKEARKPMSNPSFVLVPDDQIPQFITMDDVGRATLHVVEPMADMAGKVTVTYVEIVEHALGLRNG